MTDERSDDDCAADRQRPSRTTGKAARSLRLRGKGTKLLPRKPIRDSDTIFNGALLEDIRQALEKSPPKLTKPQLAEMYQFDILQVLQVYPGMKISDIIKHLAARDDNAAGAQFARSVSASVKALSAAVDAPTKGRRGDNANTVRPTKTTTARDDQSPDRGFAHNPEKMPPRPRSNAGSTTEERAPELFSPRAQGSR